MDLGTVSVEDPMTEGQSKEVKTWLILEQEVMRVGKVPRGDGGVGVLFQVRGVGPETSREAGGGRNVKGTTGMSELTGRRIRGRAS